MKDFKWSGSSGPLLIAEIGGNHEGDFEYAVKLTELAIASGVDYVKFQIYTGDGLVNPLESPDRNQHFKKFELSQQQHIMLAEMCIQAGVGYTASIWESEPLNWLGPYLDFVKIGSGDLTAYNMIREIVKTQLPILISTGLATESEVLDVVSYIRSLDKRYSSPSMLGILQCTSMYPIPPSDSNLNVMVRLKELSKCSVGYSDHTRGTVALETAVAMGAEILEFHFTDSRENKSFRDHKVSLTKEEVISLRKNINTIEKLKGSATKQPLKVEGDHVISFRRAVYPSKDIGAGSVLSADNLTTLRPNHGISAVEYDELIGKVLVVDVKKHQRLAWDMIK